MDLSNVWTVSILNTSPRVESAKCVDRFASNVARTVDLLRCHYSVIKPRKILLFGTVALTPAVPAGILN